MLRSQVRIVRPIPSLAYLAADPAIPGKKRGPRSRAGQLFVSAALTSSYVADVRLLSATKDIW